MNVAEKRATVRKQERGQSNNALVVGKRNLVAERDKE